MAYSHPPPQYSAYPPPTNGQFPGQQYSAPPYPNNQRHQDPQPSFSTDGVWQSNLNSSVEISIKCRGLADADVFSKSDPSKFSSIAIGLLAVAGVNEDIWAETRGTNRGIINVASSFLTVPVMNPMTSLDSWCLGQAKIMHGASVNEVRLVCQLLEFYTHFYFTVVVMFIQGLGTREWREFGRTEMIKNTLNPDFVKKFVIDYFFEERQNLRFDVYDIDSKSASLDKHDFLGRVFCTLGEIVGSPSSKYEAPLRINGRMKGRIIITAEELDSSKDVVFMKWNGKKLDKKDLFGKSDPFMVFCRCNEDNSFTVCHKTEVIKNTLNPTWKEIEIPVRTLCNGDLERTIKVEVYDWDRDGGHDLIGIFTTSLSRLSRGPSIENTYECINPKKQAKKKKYKHSGLCNLLQFRIQKQPTFLEYIRCGTELSFIVAIDFTASNGNPLQPGSLHYINPTQPNQYAIAIQSVGDIVQDYDTDKMFPAYGFGARLPPHGQVSHLFPINFNQQNPYCNGIAGVMEAYQSCIRKVQLYGPTNFSPIIRSVSEMAAQVTDASEYYVLLMITDGVISDMAATKEAIVHAARLPMSIIIVGVGSDDFEAMEELDGDTVRLSYRGVQAERDIVQFVPFRDYIGGGRNQVLSQARLAKDVLQEIPDQFVDYMKKRNLRPREQPPEYSVR